MAAFKKKYGPGGAVYYLVRQGWEFQTDGKCNVFYTHPNLFGRRVIARTDAGWEIRPTQ